MFWNWELFQESIQTMALRLRAHTSGAGFEGVFFFFFFFFFFLEKDPVVALPYIWVYSTDPLNQLHDQDLSTQLQDKCLSRNPQNPKRNTEERALRTTRTASCIPHTCTSATPPPSLLNSRPPGPPLPCSVHACKPPRPVDVSEQMR
jgi:hypothetical protein